MLLAASRTSSGQIRLWFLCSISIEKFVASGSTFIPMSALISSKKYTWVSCSQHHPERLAGVRGDASTLSLSEGPLVPWSAW